MTEGQPEERGSAPALNNAHASGQETVMVVLHRSRLRPRDDRLAVVREVMKLTISRSGLDRYLRRHGAGPLRDLKPQDPKPAHKPFQAQGGGWLHINVKPLRADEGRRHIFVAIDRESPQRKPQPGPAAFRATAAQPRPCRTDNDPEYIRHTLQRRAEERGIRLDHIQTGKPQQNAEVERYNYTVRHEWLEMNVKRLRRRKSPPRHGSGLTIIHALTWQSAA